MALFDRRLLAIAVSATALTFVSSGLRLGAQETSTSKSQSKSKTAVAKKDGTRRVPAYFGQLGLSETQRESIYKVQAKHRPTIEDLEKRLEDAHASVLKDCEKVLTPAQKTSLERLRKDAAEKRKAATKDMEK
jgi:Spy/CpxP family protein refolding chaperone